MAVTSSKSVWGCILVLMLAAGTKPQTATPATPSEGTSVSRSPAPTQANEQKPAPVYESSTVLKSITRLVVVDVVATDRNGAVINLDRDDFTVLEDGKVRRLVRRQP